MNNFTACQTIAQWVANFDLNDMPVPARNTAMKSWVDVLGCMVGGQTIDAVRKVHRLALNEYGTGPCRIAGTDHSTSATGAALANGAAAHALDYDDTSYAGVVHASATISAAVLAASDHSDTDGHTVFTAFIAGSEAEYAFGRAASNQIFMDGWWTTSVFGGLGAAAGASKAFGLNTDQTALAIAHALCRASGLRIANGTDAKFVGNGQVAALGITSAQLAKAGISAPLDALEGVNGMAHLIKRSPLELNLLDNLGAHWSILDPGVYLKPYPACSASHAAAEVTIELLEENDLGPDNISAVEVDAPQIVIDSLIYDIPNRVPQGQFSLPFILACVIIDRRFTVERTGSGALDDMAVRALMPKISMHHDPGLTAKSKAAEIGPECARVRIRTKGGKTIERFKSEAIGAPAKPMSEVQVENKFRELATAAGHAERAEVWLQRIRNIVNLKRCRDLWQN